MSIVADVHYYIGQIALALFAGWKLPARLLADEIGVSQCTSRVLQFLLRYIAPTCVAILALFPLWT